MNLIEYKFPAHYLLRLIITHFNYLNRYFCLIWALQTKQIKQYS